MISEDQLSGYLQLMFGEASAPGAALHHMLVAYTDPAVLTALGMPRVDVGVYAIAPVDTDADAFLLWTIVDTASGLRRIGKTIHFVVLTTEEYHVIADGDEAMENLGRRLMADHELDKHPNAVEVTRLYAACRDGRRWLGERFVTGPNAGATSGPTVREGSLAPEEIGARQRLIRAMVDLPYREWSKPWRKL